MVLVMEIKYADGSNRLIVLLWNKIKDFWNDYGINRDRLQDNSCGFPVASGMKTIPKIEKDLLKTSYIYRTHMAKAIRIVFYLKDILNV